MAQDTTRSHVTTQSRHGECPMAQGPTRAGMTRPVSVIATSKRRLRASASPKSFEGKQSPVATGVETATGASWRCLGPSCELRSEKINITVGDGIWPVLTAQWAYAIIVPVRN